MLSDAQLAQLAPSCTVLSTVTQEDNEEAWLHNRTRGIGGSDVGSICGVNQWSSARQVYFKKIGMYEDEMKPSAAAEERMHWGHMLEPVVAQEFESRHPDMQCVEAGATFYNNDVNYLLANVDRFLVDRNGTIVGILECKTANENLKSEWAEGEVPVSYYYQVQHYLHVTGLNQAWIACLVGGNKFFEYPIYYDRALYDKVIMPALKDFWEEHVKKCIEPDAMAADCDFYDTLFAPSNTKAEAVELQDESYDSICEQILWLKQDIKDREQKLKAMQATVKSILGDNAYGMTDEHEISWLPRKRSTINTKALRENFPEAYEACLNTTEYRVLTIKRVNYDA